MQRALCAYILQSSPMFCSCYYYLIYIIDYFTQTIHLVMYTSKTTSSLTTNPKILTILIHSGIKRRGNFHHPLISFGGLFSKGLMPLLNAACHKWGYKVQSFLQHWVPFFFVIAVIVVLFQISKLYSLFNLFIFSN